MKVLQHLCAPRTRHLMLLFHLQHLSKFYILATLSKFACCISYRMLAIAHEPNSRDFADSVQGTASHDFIKHGAQILAKTIVAPGVFSEHHDSEVNLLVAAGLVDCLLRFLKGIFTHMFKKSIRLSACVAEPVPPETAKDIIPDPPAFVERLRFLITSARMGSSPDANTTACKCFATILEASLHSKSVWNFFKSTDQCLNLLRSFLLEDSRQELRQGVADSIRGICCTLPV